MGGPGAKVKWSYRASHPRLARTPSGVRRVTIKRIMHRWERHHPARAGAAGWFPRGRHGHCTRYCLVSGPGPLQHVSTRRAQGPAVRSTRHTATLSYRVCCLMQPVADACRTIALSMTRS